MQFSSSLKLNHIFRRLYRKGSSAANGYLVLYCRKNGSQANRVGCRRRTVTRHRRGLRGAGARLSFACRKARPADGEHAVKRVLLLLIRLYQKHISPGLPRRCRFSPTCSQYALEAITKYGALKGGWLTLKRLLRCNPFYKGDYFDPVP